MRALVWLTETTWQATVDAAARLVPEGAELTLLYVLAGDAEGVVHGARAGLLGRRHPPPPPDEPDLGSISEAAAAALLADAGERLGRPARELLRRGRIEHEVVSAAAEADLLVMPRIGRDAHPGPHSIGHPARFVVDHASCEVLLVWATQAPPLPRQS